MNSRQLSVIVVLAGNDVTADETGKLRAQSFVGIITSFNRDPVYHRHSGLRLTKTEL